MKTLYAYRPEDLTRPVRYEPFKDNESLIVAIMERSSQGFLCRVKDEPRKIKMSFTMTQLEPNERIINGQTYCSIDHGRTVGICNNRKFVGAYVKEFSGYTFWKFDGDLTTEKESIQ